MNIFYRYIYITFLSLFIFSGCANDDKINNKENKNSSIDVEKTDAESKQSECTVEKSRRIISGNSMSPMIQNKDFVWLYPDYYSICNILPSVGDLAAYDYAGKDIPIIKKVVATPKDIVQMKNGKLWINGFEEKNSGGQSYTFSKSEQKLLTMAAVNRHLPKGSVLLLGDNIHNSQDSRKFGAVGVNDLLGKFEIY